MEMTPKTQAAIERVRELHAQAEAGGQRLTLAEIGREIGCSRTHAARLLDLAGLAPMPRAKKAPRPKPAPMPRQESGRRGGMARTAAKLESARANIRRALAARVTNAELAKMNRTELEIAATLAKTPAARRRYLLRIVRRDLTLTPRQKEALAECEEAIRAARERRKGRA